ncbi:uncharacterized protein LOC124266120 isoform X2 [Haliotis rubra]|uniref:uncharacterized protein LOC124266120 isoform X2 n=1 Tax=Haliotis rubra TaxID=36100 RepID=UPI001EE59E9E|nr:uncharacterized protein LOC124266120 isoform X2 [Haliotis rubra]
MTMSPHDSLTMDRVTVCTVALITAVYSEQNPPEAFSQRTHRVFRGEDVSICHGISGNPPPGIVKWKKVGVTSQWITSDCRLRPVNESHSGDYLFVMKNTMFDNIRKEERIGTGVQLVRLLVSYGAQVMCPSNYTAVENTTAVLECHVDAYPGANITWSREGSHEALPQTGSSLRIPHAQLSDGGNYTCTASNTISDYTGRTYKKEDSCIIHVIVKVNMSDGAAPETTSIFDLYKIHFIAASLGTVVLAFVVVDVVKCIRRRSKRKGDDVPVEVDGSGDSHSIHTGGNNRKDYDKPSPDNQVQHHYRQVHADDDGCYGNVVTADTQHYGNVFPENQSGYYGNVTVQEGENTCYYGNDDVVMETHSHEYVNL